MHTLVARLVDLFFPRRCVSCGRRGAWLCLRCRPSLPRLPDHRCQRCASPIAGVALCSDCWRDPPAFDSLICAYSFEGPLRTAIHHLKYRRGTHLADPLAEAVLAVVTLPEIDRLVPVPLHPHRLTARGYNQAELLAQAYGRHLSRPVAASALIRVRETPAQTRLSAARRRANLRGAFVARPEEVQGQRVLLVDDVATTTGTLRAAAHALKEAGAARVDALIVARTL